MGKGGNQSSASHVWKNNCSNICVRSRTIIQWQNHAAHWREIFQDSQGKWDYRGWIEMGKISCVTASPRSSVLLKKKKEDVLVFSYEERRPWEKHHRTKVILDLHKTHTRLVTYEPTNKITLLPLTKILPFPLIKFHLPSTKILVKFSNLQLIIMKVSLPTAPPCSQITKILPSIAILSSNLPKYLP